MTVVAIVLGVLCVLLARGTVRAHRRLEASHEEWGDPANFSRIVKAMTTRIKRTGDWEALERMRYDVRRTLHDLDMLRHDPSKTELRASKVQSTAN